MIFQAEILLLDCCNPICYHSKYDSDSSRSSNLIPSRFISGTKKWKNSHHLFLWSFKTFPDCYDCDHCIAIFKIKEVANEWYCIALMFMFVYIDKFLLLWSWFGLWKQHGWNMRVESKPSKLTSLMHGANKNMEVL